MVAAIGYHAGVMSSADLQRSILVRAPARLHLGFFDLNGSYGRRFGSLGLAITGVEAAISAGPSRALDVRGPMAARVAEIARAVADHCQRPCELAVTVKAMPPAHAGLGSGTLLSLAAGAACAAALGVELDARTLARLTGRGARSGIGIAAFEQGGFLVDGGRGAATDLPPLLARVGFPEDWRCVLVFDERQAGLSGVAERTAFDTLTPMPDAEAAELSRRVLVGLLPALHEQDFDAFSMHLGQIQARVGAHFAPAQGGVFTSAPVAALLKTIAELFGLAGIGQSSWGPTGFIVTPDVQTAEQVVAFARQRAAEGLRCQIVAGANAGAIRQAELAEPASVPSPLGE